MNGKFNLKLIGFLMCTGSMTVPKSKADMLFQKVNSSRHNTIFEYFREVEQHNSNQKFYISLNVPGCHYDVSWHNVFGLVLADIEFLS